MNDVQLNEVTFGYQLPATDALRTGRFEVVETAVAAERAGFDSVWLGDHLAFNAPVIEGVVAAAAAVATTTSVDIGFGVLVAALRDPVWLAKQISSLQALSGDRIQLGVGIGGEFPAEWLAAGVPKTQRAPRTDELLARLPDLLGGRPTELGEPWNRPVPALEPHGTMPHLWIGGRSDPALQRAARNCAGWIGTWVDEARVRDARRRLIELLPPDTSPRIAVQVLVNVHAKRDVAAEQLSGYVDGIYGIPYHRVERYCLSGTEEEVGDGVAGLVRAGAETVVLMPATHHPVEEVPAFARVVERARAALGALAR